MTFHVKPMNAILILVTLTSGGIITDVFPGNYTWNQCMEVLQSAPHDFSDGPEGYYSSFLVCKPTIPYQKER